MTPAAFPATSGQEATTWVKVYRDLLSLTRIEPSKDVLESLVTLGQQADGGFSDTGCPRLKEQPEVPCSRLHREE